MARYDVTVWDGTRVEVVRGVGAVERNRVCDFAWRHGLRFRFEESAARTRGEGTYR